MDYRDEFYVRSYRCLLITHVLAFNQKGEKVLTLAKAAFVDYLLKNPSLLQKCLLKFNNPNKVLKSPEVLYQTNIEYGEAQDVKEFLKTVLVLEKCSYIQLKRDSEEFYLIAKNSPENFSPEQNEIWLYDLNLFKPLLTKSINVLYKSVLEDIS